jgi:hypothetical protein
MYWEVQVPMESDVQAPLLMLTKVTSSVTVEAEPSPREASSRVSWRLHLGDLRGGSAGSWSGGVFFLGDLLGYSKNVAHHMLPAMVAREAGSDQVCLVPLLVLIHHILQRTYIQVQLQT